MKVSSANRRRRQLFPTPLSPIITILNLFWMAPSSYTTLQSVSDKTSTYFRLVNYGETTHLYGNDNLRSEYGLFKEIK